MDKYINATKLEQEYNRLLMMQRKFNIYHSKPGSGDNYQQGWYDAFDLLKRTLEDEDAVLLTGETK